MSFSGLSSIPQVSQKREGILHLKAILVENPESATVEEKTYLWKNLGYQRKELDCRWTIKLFEIWRILLKGVLEMMDYTYLLHSGKIDA